MLLWQQMVNNIVTDYTLLCLLKIWTYRRYVYTFNTEDIHISSDILVIQKQKLQDSRYRL